MSELRFCFTVYEDNEQEEAGDTLTHTWIKPDWPPCTTKYFYLWGKVAGVTCVSTSPPFKHHNSYVAPAEQEVTLFTGAGSDIFAYFNYRGAWTWRINHGYSYAGYHSWDFRQGGGGFRFLDLPLNPTSNVIEARIVFLPYTSQSFDVCKSRIRIEDNVTPATFSTLANFQARSQYGVEIRFDGIEHWIVPNWYQSVDISEFLNYIITKPGWVSGNNVAITWDDWWNLSDSGASRWCHGGSANPLTQCPRLYIKYEP